MDRYSWNPYGTWGHWTQGNIWWSSADEYYQVMKNPSSIKIIVTRNGATVNVIFKIAAANSNIYFMNFICENMSQVVNVGIAAENVTFTLDYIKMECDKQANTYGKTVGGWEDSTGDYLIGSFSKTTAKTTTVNFHQTGCIGSSAVWGDGCWRTAILVLEAGGNKALAGRCDWAGWGKDGVCSNPTITNDYSFGTADGVVTEVFSSANISMTLVADGAGNLKVTVKVTPDRGQYIGQTITMTYTISLLADTVNAYIGAEFATFKITNNVFL